MAFHAAHALHDPGDDDEQYSLQERNQYLCAEALARADWNGRLFLQARSQPEDKLLDDVEYQASPDDEYPLQWLCSFKARNQPEGTHLGDEEYGFCSSAGSVWSSDAVWILL